MGTRLQRLLSELDEAAKFDHRICSHGGVLYSPHWNVKTQEKAIADGVVKVCACESKFPYLGWKYLIRPSAV